LPHVRLILGYDLWYSTTESDMVGISGLVKSNGLEMQAICKFLL
jgi:hypothetical protein